MTRKSLGLTVGLITAMALTGTAFAQTPTVSQGATGTQEPGSGGHAIAVEIDTTGQTLVRGVLQSVTQNGMVLSTWGGNWTITMTPNTQIIPAMTSGSNAFQPGDIVGVLGVMSQQQNLTVEASVIHDWTATGQASGASGAGMSGTGVQGFGQSFYQGSGGLLGQGTGTSNTSPGMGTSGSNGNGATNNTGAPQNGQSAGKWGTLYTGTASNVGANSFTLLSGGTSYTVAINSSTIILDNARNAMSYSRIQPNDSIRVDGHLSGSTITATVVRDTSR